MKRILPLAIALAGASFAQETYDVAAFWYTLNEYRLKNDIRDLYSDLSLPDTINLYNLPVPVTWKSSDTLFLSHDGHINGRLVGENKKVTLTAYLHDTHSSTVEPKNFEVSIHGYEPYSNYLFAYFPAIFWPFLFPFPGGSVNSLRIAYLRPGV